MDVPVSVFRAHLSEWIERARDGEEVVLTDRGKAVARLLPPDHHSFLERLEAEGAIGPAPKVKKKAGEIRKVTVRESLSDIVIEQRGRA